MKFVVLLSVLAVSAAAVSGAEEQTRDKRGVLGLGGYSALGYGGYPALGLGYGYGGYAAPLPIAHAPIAKVIAPLPAIKVIQPYPAIAKVGYSAPLLPSYGLGYGAYHGGYHGAYHGYGGLGYGYGGLLH